ncbi:CoA ester lyase [Cellulomonas sp. KRMCY2]|uniref:HpcH/HpaI aldolase/citrate lyase family protein n=1 Tax=Cellulomonas sp. KRMCY2 TaxID=1304865 RepID=UPI00045E64FB|nr:CoA ester lyase [Cellulomonas sp. KRMCY2]
MRPLVITLLYAPADRPDLVAKALASEADVVIVDLEDAVAAGHKDSARAAVSTLLAGTERPVQVRVNHGGTSWHEADCDAVRGLPPAVGVRVPKVESVRDVQRLVAALHGRELHVLVESALGVEHAFDIATTPGVVSIGLGEADLRSDLRLTDDAGLAWARGRIVNAARAAGLPAPSMSVYPHLRDEAGLVASCRAGRALGFVGRAAIHPAQLAPIRDAFRPSAAEVRTAQDVLAQVQRARADEVGAVVLADGTFLDVAMIEQARAVLALAGRDGTDPQRDRPLAGT